jgi:hypothetical protein
MAVGKGLDRLAHLGLHVELLNMADQNMVVGLSDKQIAARLGIGKNKIGPMIDWLHEQKMVYRFGGNHGQGTKQGYRIIKVYQIPVKGTTVPVKGKPVPVKGTGSGYEIPVKGTHLISHDPMVLHEKKKEEDDDRRRRHHQFFEDNIELKVIWGHYRHNPSTNPHRDKDETIELWPNVVEKVGLPAICEYFELFNESNTSHKTPRFVEHLHRLMNKIVL